MSRANDAYVSFLRSLPDINEIGRKTQLVYSVSGTSFCWISLNSDLIQIFPPLGNNKHPTRALKKEGADVICVNCRTGAMDAKYYDPKGILEPSWSYPGFRAGSIDLDYGVSMIRQAYDQARSYRGKKDEPQTPLDEKAKRHTTTTSPDGPQMDSVLDIAEGQTGISYSKIFGPYLRGAKTIKLVDPYLRFDYQIRNFMEFCKCLSPQGTVNLELVTGSDSREKGIELSGKLNELKESLLQRGIIFKYKIDNTPHDREIGTDNGWRILLGRGLDIFQRPRGRFSLDAIEQSQRRCKATTITYLRTP